MNTDYPAGAFFKDKAKSRVDVALGRKKADEAQWRAACQQVDRRDNARCRACGSRCNPQGMDLLDRGHRHHVEFRSHGGQDVPSNVTTLCARCHDQVHVKRTLKIEPTTKHGADGPLDIWRKSEDGEWYLSRHETAVHRVERD